MSNLPPELLQILDQAHFLHVLATDPSKVVPPGKSLLSVLARAPPDSDPSPLHAEVKKVFHRAFWDEALQSLSSDSPAVQLSRLKFLYEDLQEALIPLLPPKHPILQALAAPLPPTSSPLRSMVTLLKDILSALRQRCAPVRDPDIDALLANLAEPPELVLHQSFPGRAPDNPVASLIISSIKSIITLAGTLKRDLTNTIFGTMSETQLTGIIRQQAHARERELILDSRMWGGVEGKNGVKVVTLEWTSWLGTKTGDVKWTARLLHALASSTPVTCRPFNTDSNALPPQLFFSRPCLFRVQNYLQALVITASLKALVRLTASSKDSSSVISSLDLVPRVWSLLRAEMDREDNSSGHAGINTESVAYHTKLVNLADEVVRAQRLFAPLSEADEHKLRVTVEQTLRLEDPVFVLLRDRLIRAIEQRVGDVTTSRPSESALGVPEKMRTGAGISGARQTSSVNSARVHVNGRLSKALFIKGFEDELLESGIQEIVGQILICVSWVEDIWGDTISESS